MQPARELLSAAACEAGFEAFEDTDDGLLGYVQRRCMTRRHSMPAIADYMPEGAAVSYAVEEVPDQNWNQSWETRASSYWRKRQPRNLRCQAHRPRDVRWRRRRDAHLY